MVVNIDHLPKAACPYWARMMVRGDGAILGFCSFEERETLGELEVPHSERCLVVLGATAQDARLRAKMYPWIFIVRPGAEPDTAQAVAGSSLGSSRLTEARLTEAEWNELTEWFRGFVFR